MNRTDRLLAIILELQSKTVCRAEELAATFEISKRTVYRDMEALAEAGVPIVATPGRGYALVEGYFLPPVRFTIEEAITLLLGTTLMAQTFDTDYQRAATTAGQKIGALLNDSDRTRVADLQARIQFIVPPRINQAGEQVAIPKLRRAVLESRLVRFAYHARHYTDDGRAAAEVREVEPYHLVNVSGNWQLIGYCLLRQDMRVFRLSRMTNIQPLSRAFDRAVHQDLFDQRQQRAARPEYPFKAELWFDAESARWIMEDPFFYIADRRVDEQGDVRVLLSAPDAQAVMQWILSWGRHITILEPESLREQVIDELHAALDQAGTRANEI